MSTFSGSLQDVKARWFAAQVGGLSTLSYNDQVNNFLALQLGVSINSGMTTSDMWRKFLKGKGQPEGTFNDMYKQELIKSIGGSANSGMALSELELIFYGNTANAFA